MITLYDLPTKTVPGTVITWRTRYALNLKKLPFQVVDVELPDVEALAKKIGAAPTSTKSDAYLDKTYPSSGHVLIPTGTMTLQLAFSSAVVDIFTPFEPFFDHNITIKMNDATAEYFMRVRLGGVAKVDTPEDEEREKLWAKAKENLGKMNKWFEGNEGNFVMGNEPSFADTAICAFLQFTRTMFAEESEERKDIASWNDGRWGRYLESFKPYEQLL
ncbi:uncharacterized protein ARMOST_02269 [Armillaria ostoyae]|uniref:Glutathione S-transferase UstS-like C-terminal domain-containing protein n=1 Tax=Armillaria ostoyae TaxID=47428 RepID=A0A284QR93_ARMOS|nr:uncharacterized protein ARMOST_02269 [Armillaria ostoyae]